MGKSVLANMTCPVARTLDVVGDAWTLMIVRELFLGSRRFDEMAAQTGMSPHLLSVRLKKLVEAGLLSRKAYQERPARHAYRLTAKGRDLWPVVIALKQWGDRWGDWGTDGPPLQLRHAGCGGHSSPSLVCSGCGEPVDALTMVPELGAAMASERAARAPSANPGSTPCSDSPPSA